MEGGDAFSLSCHEISSCISIGQKINVSLLERKNNWNTIQGDGRLGVVREKGKREIWGFGCFFS